MDKKLKDLGWANSWKEIPDEVKNCDAMAHNKSDVDVGPPHRGLEHQVVCKICGYIYRYDSSD